MARRLVLSLVVALGLLLPAVTGTADAGPPSDTTPPVIHVGFPQPGQRVPRLSGFFGPRFQCFDDEAGHSGIDTCESTHLDTVTLGPTSITFTARDLAGNVTTRTIHFRIVHVQCWGQPVDVYQELGDEPTAGDDVIFAAVEDEGVRIDAGRGDDRICAVRGGGDNVVHGGPGDDHVLFSGTAYGEGGDDVLFGNVSHDRLFGGPGRDLLVAGEGVDRLAGGPGRDRLDGGPNLDTCVRPIRDDVVISCERR